MFWWKKTDVSSSFEIRRNWKKTIFDRSAALAIAAVLLLPFSLFTSYDLFLTANAAADPTITSLSVTSGPVSGGTSVTINGSGFTDHLQFQEISVGTNHACGISNGNAYCWGSNGYSQLGVGSGTYSPEPVLVDRSGVLAGKTLTSISSGHLYSCAVTTAGEGVCWGNNNASQFGNGASESGGSPPTLVDMTGVLAGKQFKMISAGKSVTTCGVTTDNLAYCWGSGWGGELGDGNSTSSSVPVAVDTSGVLNGKQIATVRVGDENSCVRTLDKQVYCWGVNSQGQFGNNTTTDSPVPTGVYMGGVLSGKNIEKLALNGNHVCVVADDSKAYCWGDNQFGQLGDNSTTDRLVPVAVDMTGALTGKNINSIASSSRHTCALATDNTTACWGQNVSGQLGDNSTSDSLIPVAVDATGVLAGKTITSIVITSNTSCVTTTIESVSCWGFNGNGELGDGTQTNSSVPTQMYNSYYRPVVRFGGVNATSVVVVDENTITAISPAHAAGPTDVVVFNPSAQYGILYNSFTYGSTPTISSISPNTGTISGNTDITITGTNFNTGSSLIDISAGNTHACAVNSNNNVYCWGDNQFGQLGDGTTTSSDTPVAVDVGGVLSGKDIVDVSVGFGGSCAIDSTGSAYCWGRGTSGELGNNATANSSVPVAVDMTGVLAGKTISSISIGSEHSCAVASDNLAYCWGKDTSGELGDVNSGNSSVPVAVFIYGALLGKTISSIEAGNNHTCVVASDNLAYCWGYNNNGQLGNNSTTKSTVPVAVDMTGVLAGKTISSISGGYQHSCAVASDNKSYCWGWNFYGQLGNNSTANSSVPVAVDDAGVLSTKTASTIVAAGVHSCVVTTDSTAHCWGNNSNGDLGDGSGIDSQTPVSVDTSGVLAGLNISQISASSSNTCVVADNGHGYCWGYNNEGQLGNNSTAKSLSPSILYENDIVEGATSVSFDGVEADSIFVVSDTQIKAKTPAHAVGQVDVVVTNPSSQTDTLTNGFEYVPAATTPDAPTALSATPAVDSVDLSWSAPLDDGGSTITNYYVQYSDDGGVSWSTFPHAPSSNTSITVTGLAGGTTYSFRVFAENSVGIGPPSNTAVSSPTYVSISISGGVGLSVLPSSSARSSSNSHTVTLDTNNSTGYTLTLQMIGADRDLTNGSSDIVPTPGTLAAPVNGLAVNSWGYRIDGVGGFGSSTTIETNVTASAFSWAGVPANGNSDTIRSSASPVTDDAFLVWYGMSVDSNAVSGSYSNTVLYTAVAN